MTQQQQEQENELLSHLTAGENREEPAEQNHVEPVSNQCVCEPLATVEEQPFKPL